ncbi:MAG: nitronate monooxygenase, partial [Alteromonadaceae bacterium]|nr:nitronate monooxygenase [Alteromonadaceae bacterium]
MSLPDILKNKLALPVICSQMSIIPTPNLVIEQGKPGLVGS